jgi:hypothetical protein
MEGHWWLCNSTRRSQPLSGPQVRVILNHKLCHLDSCLVKWVWLTLAPTFSLATSAQELMCHPTKTSSEQRWRSFLQLHYLIFQIESEPLVIFQHHLRLNKFWEAAGSPGFVVPGADSWFHLCVCVCVCVCDSLPLLFEKKAYYTRLHAARGAGLRLDTFCCLVKSFQFSLECHGKSLLQSRGWQIDPACFLFLYSLQARMVFIFSSGWKESKE